MICEGKYKVKDGRSFVIHTCLEKMDCVNYKFKSNESRKSFESTSLDNCSQYEYAWPQLGNTKFDNRKL